jgi:hypothetical protein
MPIHAQLRWSRCKCDLQAITEWGDTAEGHVNNVTYTLQIRPSFTAHIPVANCPMK